MPDRRGKPQPRGSERVSWPAVVARAAAIVEAEPVGMTLRGLFYRLVSEGRLRNTLGYYRTLSARTAEARRAGWFPALVDRGRRILRPLAFYGADDAQTWLRENYRRDRQEGQPWAVYLGVEKDALADVIASWFDRLGLPLLPVRGYASQTFTDDVVADVEAAMDQGDRRSVLIYAGDFDPSGEDILRDFRVRTLDVFDRYERVALTREQVERYDLPPQMGKAKDSRAADFIRRHGRLIQVELDALPLATMRALYQDAIDRYLDTAKFEAVLPREEADRAELRDRWT
jgi:hypothetical protein